MKRKVFKGLALSVLLTTVWACDKTEEAPPELTGEYFTYSLNGSSGAAIEGRDSLSAIRQDSTTTLYGKSVPGGYELSLAFKSGIDSGAFAITAMDIKAAGEVYHYDSSSGVVSVSSYGQPGQYITGRYTAVLGDTAASSTLSFPVNGIFRIKREQ